MGKLEEVHRRAKDGWTKRLKEQIIYYFCLGKLIKPFVVDIEWKNKVL